MDVLIWLGGLLALFSFFSFFINLILIVFSKNNRTFYVKGLIYSVIAFIIGFGTCSATLNFFNLKI